MTYARLTDANALTMRIKIIFCLSGFSIALLSVIIALYTILPSSTFSTAIISQNSFSLAIFKKVVQQSGVDDFLSRLTLIVSGDHHRRKPERKCDSRKWKSSLISIYNVALVLTVDSKGCADFKSVQEAVNAVPDSSPSRTLIVIDSGTYRSFSHTKFSSLVYFSFYHNSYKSKLFTSICNCKMDNTEHMQL